jgi:hypothetical protein
MNKKKVYGITATAALILGMSGSAAWAVQGTVTNTNVVANTAVVSACDTTWDLALGTPTYDATNARYEISSVSFSNVAPECVGQTIAVTVTDSSNGALSSGTLTIAGTTGTVTLAAPVGAELVTGTSSAIYS